MNPRLIGHRVVLYGKSLLPESIILQAVRLKVLYVTKAPIYCRSVKILSVDSTILLWHGGAA
jgi:hypothetical protein